MNRSRRAEPSWPQARAAARSVVGPDGPVAPVTPVVLPLGSAAGTVLAEDAVARTDQPPHDTSAMDGWAVAGPPPWRVVGRVLAGDDTAARFAGRALDRGQAVEIATGAFLPPGADAVLRRENGLPAPSTGAPEEGSQSGSWLRPDGSAPGVGTDIRPAGQECRAGDVVLSAGSEIGPVAVGLLAAAGLDRARVRRLSADVLVVGDELLTSGPARQGRVRDALGPLLSAWLPARGIEIASRRYVPDTHPALATALSGCLGDLVITTGSTARGPVDHLHAVLEAAGASLVVDGVAVRPGHPQLLAVLADRRPLIGLPGNPLAAVSGLLTLLDPLARALRGLPPARRVEAVAAVDVPAGTEATRLVPLRDGRPVLYAGPAMLRGLATADHVAVIPPGGVATGGRVEVLLLP